LEYLTAPNPDLDGDAMVDALLAATEAVLKRRYELPDEWRIAPDWVIELDSTSDRKFSRHLVLQLHSESTPIAFRFYPSSSPWLQNGCNTHQSVCRSRMLVV
jgi:hypothetical protein